MNFSLAKSLDASGGFNGQFFRATNGIIFLPCLIAGTLKEIHIITPMIIVQSAVFNVRLNGSNLFTTSDRPTITAGHSNVSKTGLNVTVAFASGMLLDLNSIGQSSLHTPITLIAVIDDGITY